MAWYIKEYSPSLIDLFRSLISLLGFCDEGNENILVYEFAERGSLETYLNSPTLTWKRRLDICLGAARGLDYLHNQVAEHKRILHRDIKSSNILLDQNWNALISDLGLSKIGPANENDTFLITNPCGTQGYCDPAYIETGILTKKSDVYSFGIVLFEVLCGRPCFVNKNNEQRFLAPLARRCYESDKLDTIVYPDLEKQTSSSCLKKFSTIAYQCLHKDREQRPSMDVIVKKLEEVQLFQDKLVSQKNNSFKVVLVGDRMVGKSQILARFLGKDFNISLKSSIGVDFQIRSLYLQNKFVKAQIWDVAGSEMYKIVINQYCKDAVGAMLVYDITKSKSFDHIPKWLKQIRFQADKNINIILVGNKNDLEHQRVVSTEDAKKFAQKEGLFFLETSALDATNIDEAFSVILTGALKVRDENSTSSSSV